MSEPDPGSRPPSPAERLAVEGGGRRRRQSDRRRPAKERRGAPRVSLLAMMIFMLVFAGVGGYMFLAGYISPPDYSGRGTSPVVIRVDEGATVSEIGVTLEQEGVVKSSRAFVQAAEGHPEATSIQPGYYRLRHRMEAGLAFELLLAPKSRVEATVTIPEGKRLSEVFTIIAENTDLSRAALKKAAKDRDELGLPAYAKTVEGYLFPATYTVGPDVTAKQLLRQMVDEFKATAAKLDLAQQADTRRMSPHEIVTIASLVQGEVSRAQDFPKAAAVVYNRLQEGMPLEFSSTVNYALDQRKLGVSSRETEVESPYNTYVHEGLPPGPINSPGMRALEAALNPANGDWLYFVTTNPQQGITKFTSDYQEFLKFKAQFKRNTP